MRSTREVTEGGARVLALRIDRITDGPTAAATTLYCTDVEGTEVRVAVRDPSAVSLPPETGEWCRFDGVVRSGSRRSELVVAPDGRTERIEPPDRRPHPSPADLDDPWVIRLGASEQRIVVTVQPRPTDEAIGVRAGDPETFEIGAVCLADPGDPGDATVYHRERPDAEDERLLLQHVVGDLSEAAGATLVSRGGDRSPIEMLRTRLVSAAGGDTVETGAERVLDGCFHADLSHVAARAGADTLEGAARGFGVEVDPTPLDDYDIGIDPTDLRADRDTDPVSSAGAEMSDRDYAALVERYLDAEDDSAATAELGRCLKDYASADLDLLRAVVAHGVADPLACPRLAAKSREP